MAVTVAVRDVGLEAADNSRLVVIAASLGTVFEWYDFFLYGSLAVFFSGLFFPPGNETAAFLASLATFGAGFAVRPFGAMVFGALGERIFRGEAVADGQGDVTLLSETDAKSIIALA